MTIARLPAAAVPGWRQPRSPHGPALPSSPTQERQRRVKRCLVQDGNGIELDTLWCDLGRCSRTVKLRRLSLPSQASDFGVSLNERKKRNYDRNCVINLILIILIQERDANVRKLVQTVAVKKMPCLFFQASSGDLNSMTVKEARRMSITTPKGRRNQRA